MSLEIFRFEDFELDRNAHELRQGGKTVRLERIPLELLFLMVEKKGRLVTRQEIIDSIWGKDVFFDADNSINTAVRKIRNALKEDPGNPRLLHTIAGKGYRFVVPTLDSGQTPDALSEQSSLAVHGADSLRLSWPRRWLLWLVAAAIAVIATVVAIIVLYFFPQPGNGKAMLVVVPFLNISDDSHQEYLADGMTEEMIAELGNLDPIHLGVIARTTAMQFKGTPQGRSPDCA